MRLQKTDKPLCMLYSLAMVLDIEATELDLPDGMEQVWPFHVRGHHIDEICACALRHGVALVRFDVVPAMAPGPGFEPLILESRRPNGRGIIQGMSMGGYHAVAYENGIIYNPTNAIMITEQFYLEAYNVRS